jgi:hypothetical protein
LIPATMTRVERSTDESINKRIARRTACNLSLVAQQGPTEINRRLEELDYEWDIERTLEANAASLALLGLGLGAFVDRRFFMFPVLVAGFLLEHAVQGWCPPIPLFRRLGVRTAREIYVERIALKVLRGDFNGLSESNNEIGNGDPQRLMEAVNR